MGHIHVYSPRSPGVDPFSRRIAQPRVSKMKLDDDKHAGKEDAISPPSPPPPPYTASRPPPPSGFRIALTTSSPFPPPTYTRDPACYDSDGQNPIFIGSAIFSNSVHPCKIGPTLVPPCRVPYGGSEVEHHGRYDLLPFDKETMEWVPTSLGRIPAHRRPVQGGYEESGAYLYHALATVRDTKVPGKTGEHLGGCNVAFDGVEHVITRGYDILCWR